MYAEDDYLLISGIQHFRFCRRQWALIHVLDSLRFYYLGNHYQTKVEHFGCKPSYEAEGILIV